ncbi:hypothetical protein [Roseovarius spongiae]|uniref:hypothetical protein n=1 Tax=Roseovarius spongiae TaxID=2320272 RepID=UPI0014076260|nr:hypothetical protein [Roseovarius spongiae]
MTNKTEAAELERRLSELEKEENQGGSFTAGDWFFLLIAGVIGPAALLLWGW